MGLLLRGVEGKGCQNDLCPGRQKPSCRHWTEVGQGARNLKLHHCSMHYLCIYTTLKNLKCYYYQFYHYSSYKKFIANSLLNPKVKEFLNSANIWQSSERIISLVFFMTHSVQFIVQDLADKINESVVVEWVTQTGITSIVHWARRWLRENWVTYDGVIAAGWQVTPCDTIFKAVRTHGNICVTLTCQWWYSGVYTVIWIVR